MRAKKSKFLKALAKSNTPKDAPWAEYEERVVKHNVVPTRKLIKDLNDEDKKKYVTQISIALKRAKTDEEKDKSFIVVPQVYPSIMRILKPGCGKYIYKQLKKLAVTGQLGNIVLPARINVGDN